MYKHTVYAEIYYTQFKQAIYEKVIAHRSKIKKKYRIYIRRISLEFERRKVMCSIEVWRNTHAHPQQTRGGCWNKTIVKTSSIRQFNIIREDRAITLNVLSLITYTNESLNLHNKFIEIVKYV